MSKIKEVQDRLERGYTMAVYGSYYGIYEQMTSDIETLLEALTLGDVVKPFYCWDEQALGKERRCQEECDTCASVRKEK